MSENELKNQIIPLTRASDSLSALLDTQRAALAQRNLDALTTIVGEKQALCSEIESLSKAFSSTGIADRIAAAPEAERQKLAQLHNSLRDSANRAQEYNAVNGKILQRSQQSTRELIHLISGTDADLLYGDRGRTSATVKGTAIASA